MLTNSSDGAALELQGDAHPFPDESANTLLHVQQSRLKGRTQKMWSKSSWSQQKGSQYKNLALLYSTEDAAHEEHGFGDDANVFQPNKDTQRAVHHLQKEQGDEHNLWQHQGTEQQNLPEKTQELLSLSTCSDPTCIMEIRANQTINIGVQRGSSSLEVP